MILEQKYDSMMADYSAFALINSDMEEFLSH